MRYNLPNTNKNENYTIVEIKYDWTQLYGELSEGEYEVNFNVQAPFIIKIKFTIDSNGKISTSDPEIF